MCTAAESLVAKLKLVDWPASLMQDSTVVRYQVKVDGLVVITVWRRCHNTHATGNNWSLKGKLHNPFHTLYI